jgi:hypothetical protein
MSGRDENDLSDAEIAAMWDEGEPVELATVRYTVNPSPWTPLLPRTAARLGTYRTAVVNFASFAAGAVRYPVRMEDRAAGTAR